MIHTQNEPKPSFKVGPLFVDTYLRKVSKNGAELPLTDTQFEVFLCLVKRRGEPVLRKEFGPWLREPLEGDRHPVDDVIKELRKIVGNDVPIMSARGKGYRLRPDIPVSDAAGPSVFQSDQLKAIALDRLNIFTRQSLLTSIEKYEEALGHGPDAEAYANLALNYVNQGHTGFCLDVPQHSIPKARALLEEALRHYPKFSSAFAIRGLTYAIYENDWTKADADLDRAFELNADDEFAHMVSAHLDVARQRFDSGIVHARRTAQLDWRTPMSVFTLPWMLVLAGQADEGLQECEAALKLFGPFAVGHIVCGYAWDALGVPLKAIEEYEKSIEIADFAEAYGSLGHAYAKAGDVQAARECLRKLRGVEPLAYVPAYCDALVYVGLGEKDKALDALETAHSQKCEWLTFLNVDPRWTPLRRDPRFKTLIRRVGLPTDRP
ncbi:MAG: winged helix-turn-helix domain-containing protein [Acidobacteriota bacterium]|nr:winged helix-turn-helix domain-containing protein [Acidobacteriota bacterium]